MNKLEGSFRVLKRRTVDAVLDCIDYNDNWEGLIDFIRKNVYDRFLEQEDFICSGTIKAVGIDIYNFTI